MHAWRGMCGYKRKVPCTTNAYENFGENAAIDSILSLGMVRCTVKKNMLYRLPTSLTIITFLSPTPISMRTQFINSLWVPEQNSKINLEMVPLLYF